MSTSKFRSRWFVADCMPQTTPALSKAAALSPQPWRAEFDSDDAPRSVQMPRHHAVDRKLRRLGAPGRRPPNLVRVGVVREVGELRKRKAEPAQRFPLLQLVAARGKHGERRRSQRGELLEVQERDIQRRMQAHLHLERSTRAIDESVVHLNGHASGESVLPFERPERVSRRLARRQRRTLRAERRALGRQLFRRDQLATCLQVSAKPSALTKKSVAAPATTVVSPDSRIMV